MQDGHRREAQIATVQEVADLYLGTIAALIASDSGSGEGLQKQPQQTGCQIDTFLSEQLLPV